MALDIAIIPVLSDNYVWLMHDSSSGETVVIDPAVDQPVLDAARGRGWTITQIWNTHWHADHIGGNAGIKAATGCRISGPAAEYDRIPSLDRLLSEGDIVSIGTIDAVVMEVPAHTAGHIAYHIAEENIAFVGDTLFAMGCGRLFEGTAGQMFDALGRFAMLDPETRIYCAHEYTLPNAAFAMTVEPDNAAIARRLVDVQRLRDMGQPTLPTTIALERETNPFMRANDVAELAARRTAKDNF